jgi:hypothetical protein
MPDRATAFDPSHGVVIDNVVTVLEYNPLGKLRKAGKLAPASAGYGISSQNSSL